MKAKRTTLQSEMLKSEGVMATCHHTPKTRDKRLEVPFRRRHLPWRIASSLQSKHQKSVVRKQGGHI